MKKTIFMAFSFLLAVTMLSFTSSEKGNGKSPDPEYYWYYVTYNGTSPQIEEQQPISHITLADAENLSYDCGGQDRVCKAGFLVQLSFPGGNPITSGTEGDDDARFMEVNPNP